MPSPRIPKRVPKTRRLPRGHVTRVLGKLTQEELVRETNVDPAEYIFKHALIQETVRATLLKNQSKRLHRLVAQALENVNAQRLDEYAAQLAEHFAEAEDDAKTLEYSTRAGDNALRVFASAEALEHYERALHFANSGGATDEQIIHLYKQHGRILEVVGRYEDALASYIKLHELAAARNDRALELAYLMLRAPLHSTPMVTFDAALAEQLLLDALATARELGDEAAEARVLWNLSLLSVHKMHPAEGVEYGELSLALAEKLGLKEQKAYTLHDLAMPYRAVGQIGRAREVQSQARALFRELDNKSMLADNLGMSGQYAMGEGDLAAGIALCLEGIAVSRSVDNPFGIGFNQSFAANGYLERGEYTNAFDLVQEQVAGIRRGIFRFNGIWLAGVIGLNLARVGAYAQSQEMERAARHLTQGPVPPIFRVGLRAMLGRMRLCAGDIQTAALDIADAEKGFVVSGMLEPGMIQLPLAQGELALAQHEFERAKEALRVQADWARRNELPLLLPENLCLYASACMGLEEFDEARAALEQARAHAEAIGTRRTLWRIYAGLSELEQARGNAAQAEMYCSQARGVLDYIVAHLPEELRTGFLNLPRVREVMGT